MRVRWTRVALDHLDEIQDYIAQDSPAAAYRVAAELYQRTERLLMANPHAGRVGRSRGTRELVFADLPYVVVYRTLASVEVVAVVHSARRWPEEF